LGKEKRGKKGHRKHVIRSGSSTARLWLEAALNNLVDTSSRDTGEVKTKRGERTNGEEFYREVQVGHASRNRNDGFLMVQGQTKEADRRGGKREITETWEKRFVIGTLLLGLLCV